MNVYFIVLLIAVGLAWVGNRSKNSTLRRFSIGIIILLLSLFAGFRNRSVGTDTGTYVDVFASVNSFEDVWKTTEVGYNALMLFCSLLSENYSVLLTAIALIVVGCYITTIVRITKRYETSLFLFITIGTYTFFFNVARQGIAMALCFFALIYLLERRHVAYFMLVGLAALFHHTALVAAPLYFLAGTRTGWRQIVAVVVGVIVFIVALTTIVQLAAFFLDDKYAIYSEVGEGGGRIMVTFLVSQGFMLFCLRHRVQDPNRRYQRLLNIYLIGLVPAIAATFSNIQPSGLLRINTYFSHTAILLWPMVFVGIKNNLVRGLVVLVAFITALVFFGMSISAFNDLLPYRINPTFIG